MKYANKKNEQGFTLIETAIAMLILAFILVPLFNFMTQQKMQERLRAEEALNERALSSLAMFLRQNGRYPCPADPTLARNDAGGNYGAENCALATTASSAFGTGANALPAPPERVYYGALPIKTLGLPYRYGVNRHGYKLMYAVTRDLANSATATSPPAAAGSATYDGNGGIGIVDDAGNAIYNGYAHFAIINPGSDGKGAYFIDGAVSVACGASKDSENCDGDSVFEDIDYAQLDNINDANYYDDAVLYTMAREETTFWAAQERGDAGAGTGGAIDIVNRNEGDVILGDVAGAGGPLAGKLQVVGDITATGGDIKTLNNVEADGNVNADQNITAGGRVTAPVFYYGIPPP